MPDMNLWASARRARIHLLGPSLLAITGVMVFLAHQEIVKPAGANNWSDFSSGAIIAFGISLPLFVHQTLRGPLMEPDEAVRRGRETRNMKLGLTLYVIIFVATMVFFSDRLSAGAGPTTYGAFAGFFMGMLAGIGGVWLYHHARGSWPPDSEG